jgi:hypothetical protein
VNRRTWIATVGASLFVRLDVDSSTVARTVRFSNDAIWSELVTERYATAARTTPFHPEAWGSADEADA